MLQKPTMDALTFSCCLEKATKLRKTKRARRMRAADVIGLKYEIAVDASISVEHLLAVSLYCDTNKLQSTFTKSFRKKRCESLSWLKRQNSEYALWSKLLREAVELYGSMGYVPKPFDKEHNCFLSDVAEVKKWNKAHQRVAGPFFTGMQAHLPVESFIMKLCGPVSTSMRWTVAERFTVPEHGELQQAKGLIFKFNNYGFANADELRTLDCAWIGNHKQEEECLFMGGFKPIKIEWVMRRFVSGDGDFHKFGTALFCFHAMFRGTVMIPSCAPRIKTKQVEQLGSLIQRWLPKRAKVSKAKIPEYINQCFGTFLYAQDHLVFNLHQLNTFFAPLAPLILDSSLNVKRKSFQYEDVVHYSVKDVVYELFQNVERVTIYSQNKPIDVYALSLSPILSKRNMRITMKGLRSNAGSRTWISAMFGDGNSSKKTTAQQRNTKTIRSMLKKQDYTMEHSVDWGLKANHCEDPSALYDCLVIRSQ